MLLELFILGVHGGAIWVAVLVCRGMGIKWWSLFLKQTDRKFEALSLAGGINAYINDQLSDESIYEDVDKLMKDRETWHMWMNCWLSRASPNISTVKVVSYSLLFRIVPTCRHHWKTPPSILPWFFSCAMHFSESSLVQTRLEAGRQSDSWQDHGHSFPERLWRGTEGCSDLSWIFTDMMASHSLIIFSVCSWISIPFWHMKEDVDSRFH